jgi:hypothetical protein
VVQGGFDPIQAALRSRLSRNQLSGCNYAGAKAHELRFAALALANNFPDPAPAATAKEKEKPKDDKDKPKEKAAEKKVPEPKLPEEFIGQAIKEVVMHEVGHSLGLRHNFKASILLKPEQLNDTSITRVKGMAGSVMDYNPINIAPKGQKQGDYASTTIGPYDYWAIEYAYSPADGNEEAELKKIASRSPDPELAFATDDDFASNDPQVNVYDLGSDTLAYGKDRMAIAAELLADLDKKVVKDGESWARLRPAFMTCISQFGNGAHLASEYIGGQSVHRDFKGTDKARDPVIPISGAKQREALALVVDKILSDKAFQFSPALLRKLTTENWQDSGFYFFRRDYSIYQMVQNLQEIVLDQALDPSVLGRVQDQELQSDPGSNPIKIAEIFRSLSEGIFSELSATPKATFAISTLRRNLQREYIKRLSSMVLGPKSDPFSGGGFRFIMFSGGSSSAPPDAKNLARLHLDELGKKIDHLLGEKDLKIDDTSLAHLKELRFRITRVLNAGLNANEP